MAVCHGDVIVGDQEGVLVIPAHLADEIADEAIETTAFEDFVTEEVLKGRPIIGLRTTSPSGAKPEIVKVQVDDIFTSSAEKFSIARGPRFTPSRLWGKVGMGVYAGIIQV